MLLFKLTVKKSHNETDIMKAKGSLALICWWRLIMTHMDLINLTKENGVSVLCLEILKALYGMMVSSLLFYRKLIKELEQLHRF